MNYESDDMGLSNNPKLQASFQISRQLDQEKIDFLTRRVNDLLASNNSLRQSATRNEKDTHDIVRYFQRETAAKDEIISKLEEELVTRETQLKFEVERMKKKFDSDLVRLQEESDNQIIKLSGALKTAHAEVAGYQVYVKDKDRLEARMEELEKENIEQKQQMYEALDEQERKFLEEKSQFLKVLDEQKEMLREQALREARDAMGIEVKKIFKENKRTHEELKFLHSTAHELQTDKNSLEKQLIEAKREVDILTEKDNEYAKQSYHKTKEIKSMRDRIQFLEKQSVVNIERFKQRTKDFKATVQKDLEIATLDAAGLRRLLKMKNAELRHMRTLAATILGQRTDTEQFFLEALQEVRDMIAKERKKNNGTLSLNRSKGRSQWLPKIRTNSSANQEVTTAHTSDVQAKDVKVDIRDLSWEDKELVLRILFAKMNGQERSFEIGTAPSIADTPMTKPENMPLPVFISEGAGIGLDRDEEQRYGSFQANFELNYGSDDFEDSKLRSRSSNANIRSDSLRHSTSRDHDYDDSSVASDYPNINDYIS